ncbi:MAG: hypothetical protein ACI89J_001987, partial [Hyphomicrobiaceae bacterium]
MISPNCSLWRGPCCITINNHTPTQTYNRRSAMRIAVMGTGGMGGFYGGKLAMTGQD